MERPQGGAQADTQGRGDGLAPLLIGSVKTLELISGVFAFNPFRVVMLLS